MSVIRCKAGGFVAAALLFGSLSLAAQSSGAPPANSDSSDRIRTLEQRIDKLTDSLAAALGQVDLDRRKMDSMQAEIDDLRRTIAGSGGVPGPAVENAAAQLQQAVAQIRDEQEVIASEVKQHEQTKLESASKFPVRFHGLVLFNAFVNEGVVDQPDLPTSALGGTSGMSHGSVGATLRQTFLSFEGTGPTLANGRLSGDVSFDFFGGETAGVLGAPAGVVRMRTAGIRWENDSDLVRAGFDGPLISPLSPTSVAAVAQPALAWSGNLWTWSPQLRWEHRFAISDTRRVGFELGLYDPTYTSENTIDSYRSVTPGEAARQPGYETRISYRGGKLPSFLQLGAGGYYDRKNYGGDQTVDTWAGTADWEMPFGSRTNLSGEFYRGRGIGSLGGGAYRDAYSYIVPVTHQTELSGLDSIGGWAQWQWNLIKTMQLNLAAGEDTGYAGELRQSLPPYSSAPYYYYSRNRTLMANFIYRPWSSFIFSPEFKRLDSWPIYGQVKSANVYTVSAGYEF